MPSTKMGLHASAVALLATAVGLAVFLLALAASGQPASQPVIVAPVAAAGFWPWLQANGNWFVPLLIFVLSSLVTVLSKYPRAKGLIAALRMFMGGLSVLEFKDGKRPGLTLKWPVNPPAPPPEAPKE